MVAIRASRGKKKIDIVHIASYPLGRCFSAAESCKGVFLKDLRQVTVVGLGLVGGSVALGGGSCTSCNSTNDSSQGGDNTRDGYQSLVYSCNNSGQTSAFYQTITFASDICLTGYDATLRKDGSPVANVYLQLFSTSQVAVSGTQATVAAGDLAGSYTKTEILTGSSQLVSAGTYRVVIWVSDVTTFNNGSDYIRVGTNTSDET